MLSTLSQSLEGGKIRTKTAGSASCQPKPLHHPGQSRCRLANSEKWTGLRGAVKFGSRLGGVWLCMFERVLSVFSRESYPFSDRFGNKISFLRFVWALN